MDYNKFSFQKLRNLCTKAGINDPYRMQKHELIEALMYTEHTMFDLLPIEIIEIIGLKGGMSTLKTLGEVAIRFKRYIESPNRTLSYQRIFGCQAMHRSCLLNDNLCCWCADKRSDIDVLNEILYIDGQGDINPSQYLKIWDINMYYCPTCKSKRVLTDVLRDITST